MDGSGGCDALSTAAIFVRARHASMTTRWFSADGPVYSVFTRSCHATVPDAPYADAEICFALSRSMLAPPAARTHDTKSAMSSGTHCPDSPFTRPTGHAAPPHAVRPMTSPTNQRTPSCARIAAASSHVDGARGSGADVVGV